MSFESEISNAKIVLQRWAADLAEAKDLGATRLVALIEDRTAKQRTTFDLAVSAVERFDEAERLYRDAEEELTRAVAAHNQGSLDTKRALRLRDDAEIARQAERIRRTELESARQSATALLAKITGDRQDAGRDRAAAIAEGLATKVARRYSIDFNEPDPATVPWLPLAFAKARAKYVALAKRESTPPVEDLDACFKAYMGHVDAKRRAAAEHARQLSAAFEAA